MRNLFKENYTGPRGPHLNHLTETTITGTYTESKQKSLHSGRNKKNARKEEKDD